MSPMRTIPPFEELPLRKGDPPMSAWGLWEDSKLGALNYLTDETVLEAARAEIRTGERVGLDLPLDAVNPGLLGRQVFERKIINKAPRIINDDVITFNTQTSSQWDSFRHFAYQEQAKFYNGVTQGDIHGDPCSMHGASSNWTHKGIAGRGVLIDYHAWTVEKGIQYNTTAAHPIKLESIKAIIQEKDIKIRPGDILCLRTGFVHGYSTLEKSGRAALAEEPQWPGLEQSLEVLRWLWEQQFAAVAADCPGFETFPPISHEWMLHPVLLSGWGTPIGELFNFEALSSTAAKLGRFTFFVTSAPLNYTGAVATPPNAIAIF